MPSEGDEAEHGAQRREGDGEDLQRDAGDDDGVEDLVGSRPGVDASSRVGEGELGE